MSKRTFVLFFLSLTLVFACVEPFDITFINQKDIFFIEAHLNDTDNTQSIFLRKSYTEFQTNKVIGEKNAEVYVVENKTIKYKCIEGEEGQYLLPDNFKVKPNINYYLEFTLANGNQYRSSEESAVPINPIEKLTSEFRTTGIDFDGKEMNGHEIFLDTKDPTQYENFYIWKWKFYEKQYYCKSCEGGKYYTNPLPDGICIDDAALKRRSVIYDYNCKGDCWDIYYSRDINILSDQYYNGANVKNRKIAEIPFLQFKGVLIEVTQFGISKSAYDYFKIMVSQSQNTGTLSDTPPAGLIGNVKNINDKTESVGGIFMVSCKKTQKLWIPRKERYDGMRAYGLLQGRSPNPEPMGADLTRPPMAPCQESEYRTPKMPDGWIE